MCLQDKSHTNDRECREFIDEEDTSRYYSAVDAAFMRYLRLRVFIGLFCASSSLMGIWHSTFRKY